MAKTTQAKTSTYAMKCACGFELKDPTRSEFVVIAKLHVKTSHGQVIDDKAVLAMATVT